MTRQLNELFLEWLTEWYKEAQSQNLKSRFAYKKAIDSIQSHKQPLHSAKDAGKLVGIGEKLILKLQNKLKETEHNNDDGEDAVLSQPIDSHLIEADSIDFSSVELISHSSQLPNSSPEKPKLKRKRGAGNYVPRYRSGAYAILCSLFSAGTMTKDEIITRGQIYCDSSFLSSQYSAWSSIKMLLEKELVYKYGNPALYELSEEGKVLAKRLLGNNTELVEIETSVEKETTDNPIQVMEPNSFDIYCLVDSRERPDQSNRDTFLHHFQSKRLLAMTEVLEVGDFLWIAKDKKSGAKVVLDVVVERKRHDDFISSLISNRLQEQRDRLSQCGAKRVIYLLEACRNQQVFDEFGIDRINKIIIELQHKYKFMVKSTKSFEESCVFLQNIHQLLIEKYSNQPIEYNSSDGLISFNSFQSINSKSVNLTVGDVFARQLLCLNGMTAEKARLITTKFQTIRQLNKAFLGCQSEKEGENFVSQLTDNKIKSKLSKCLYRLFYTDKSK